MRVAIKESFKIEGRRGRLRIIRVTKARGIEVRIQIGTARDRREARIAISGYRP